jgi:hypothetical protein
VFAATPANRLCHADVVDYDGIDPASLPDESAISAATVAGSAAGPYLTSRNPRPRATELGRAPLRQCRGS